MKRFVTLIFSFVILESALAQTSAEREEARKIILGQKKGGSSQPKESREVILGGDDRRIYDERTSRYPETYPNRNSTRERQIEQVNREYDYKINSIRTNNSLSNAEKERIIRQLEYDRRKRINAINKNYHGKGGKDKKYDDDDDNDDDDDDNDHYRKGKGNNGKHKGWEKGKGNQRKRNG